MRIKLLFLVILILLGFSVCYGAIKKLTKKQIRQYETMYQKGQLTKDEYNAILTRKKTYIEVLEDRKIIWIKDSKGKIVGKIYKVR